MTEGQIFAGLGLTVFLAVACQVVANRFRLPAIVLLLPVGFIAGIITDTVNPYNLFGATFAPLVDLAVAIILFDGGLDLAFRELRGDRHKVVRRLIYLGVPFTWLVVSLFASLVLGLQRDAAVMLGAILIVSGPTVVTPLLRLARPGRQCASILVFEGTMIDPIGATIGALTFQFIESGASSHPALTELGAFAVNIGVGLVGGAIGIGIIWLALKVMRASGDLAGGVLVATVVSCAAGCNAVRSSTGLIAAIVMGVTIANVPSVGVPEHRPFFATTVQLLIGLLFISISATVTPASLHDVLWPSLAIVAIIVLLVRPVVAAVGTVRTRLPRNERIFIGWMAPRGIVAAATAASFGASLVADHIPGAGKLLPATFVVIAGTVAIYGLTAVPLARLLRLVAVGDEANGAGASGRPTTEPDSNRITEPELHQDA